MKYLVEEMGELLVEQAIPDVYGVDGVYAVDMVFAVCDDGDGVTDEQKVDGILINDHSQKTTEVLALLD